MPWPSRVILAILILAAVIVTAEESYYDVLGVPKDADEKAIKKAYKKMALQWHPDKNPDNKEDAEKRFRQVAEAYEVLSNPDRRRTYDQGGSSGATDFGGGGFGGFGGFGGSGGFKFQDPKDLFKEMFGDEDPFADFNKFFSDVQTFEETVGEDGGALDKLEKALINFYTSIGEKEKGQLESVRNVMQSSKWAGRLDKLGKSLQKKYANPDYAAALRQLMDAFQKYEQSTKSSSDGADASFGFANFGGFPGFGDFGGFGGFKDFGSGAGGSTVFSSSFSSSSSSSGGKTVRTETRIENGKRVTKTIETDGSGTRATMEEQHGNRIKRQTGSRAAEQLDAGRNEF